MHILITGAAGMIGRKLTERLVRDGALNGKPIEKLTLTDIVAPAKPPALPARWTSRRPPISRTRRSRAGTSPTRPDVIFHLAGDRVGRGGARFRQGLSHQSRRHARSARGDPQTGDGYVPKFVFTSSIAVFGAPFPDAIPDDFHLTPLTSYGTQKAICELLLADYTRKGLLDGVGIRLPSIVVRPGKPNKAASGFFSGIIREPLAGEEAVLPVDGKASCTGTRARARRSASSSMRRD